jgi:hypothetical protein
VISAWADLQCQSKSSWQQLAAMIGRASLKDKNDEFAER